MSHRLPAAVLAAAVVVLAIAVPVSAATGSVGRRAADAHAYGGRYIVTWKAGAPDSRAGLRVSGVQHTEAMNRTMRTIVTAKAGEGADVAAHLRNDPRVLSVVPDAKMTAIQAQAPARDALTARIVAAGAGDPLSDMQTDLAQIGVPDAWSVTEGDPGVVVAVIDTGVDVDHPDLAGVNVVAPRSELWNLDTQTDDNGHGTHVAGTIFARHDNGIGIAGIAPDASLMPIKVLDDRGSGSFATILDGVDWAREHGARIANLSLGGYLTPEQAALGAPTFEAARAAGMLVVAASGNSGSSARLYPASFPGVVSVGAVDGANVVADFSTTGKALDIVAPGVELWSTIVLPRQDGSLEETYEPDSGTSMASPHVAGVAALLLAHRPALMPDQAEAILRTTAHDLGGPGHDTIYGDGLVNAAAAMDAPIPDPLPPLDPPPALGKLTLTFTDPADAVVTTATTYTVRSTVSHAYVDAAALIYWVPITMGECDWWSLNEGHRFVAYSEAIVLSMTPGRCYAVEAAVTDEDGNWDDEVSPDIMVLDHTRPAVVRHRPAATRGVPVGTSPSVTFSEPVVRATSAVRLRNLHTNLTVRARLMYDARTRTLKIDPRYLMYRHTRYRIEVTSGVRDLSGNSIRPVTFTFTTGG